MAVGGRASPAPINAQSSTGRTVPLSHSGSSSSLLRPGDTSGAPRMNGSSSASKLPEPYAALGLGSSSSSTLPAILQRNGAAGAPPAGAASGKEGGSPAGRPRNLPELRNGLSPSASAEGRLPDGGGGGGGGIDAGTQVKLQEFLARLSVRPAGRRFSRSVGHSFAEGRPAPARHPQKANSGLLTALGALTSKVESLETRIAVRPPRPAPRTPERSPPAGRRAGLGRRAEPDAVAAEPEPPPLPPAGLAGAGEAQQRGVLAELETRTAVVSRQLVSLEAQLRAAEERAGAGASGAAARTWRCASSGGLGPAAAGGPEDAGAGTLRRQMELVAEQVITRRLVAVEERITAHRTEAEDALAQLRVQIAEHRMAAGAAGAQGGENAFDMRQILQERPAEGAGDVNPRLLAELETRSKDQSDRLTLMFRDELQVEAARSRELHEELRASLAQVQEELAAVRAGREPAPPVPAPAGDKGEEAAAGAPLKAVEELRGELGRLGARVEEREKQAAAAAAQLAGGLQGHLEELRTRLEQLHGRLDRPPPPPPELAEVKEQLARVQARLEAPPAGVQELGAVVSQLQARLDALQAPRPPEVRAARPSFPSGLARPPHAGRRAGRLPPGLLRSPALLPPRGGSFTGAGGEASPAPGAGAGAGSEGGGGEAEPRGSDVDRALAEWEARNRETAEQIAHKMLETLKREAAKTKQLKGELTKVVDRVSRIEERLPPPA
eukprot:tig00020830_g14504.t1